MKYKKSDRVVLRSYYAEMYGEEFVVKSVSNSTYILKNECKVIIGSDEMIDHEATERLKKSTGLREQAVKEDVFELYQKAQPERDKSNKKVWDKMQAKKKAAESQIRDVGCDFGAGESTGYAVYSGGIRAGKSMMIFDRLNEELATTGKVIFPSNPSKAESWLYKKWIEGEFPKSDDPYWHAPKTPFEQARDLFLDNHSQEVSGVYQGLKKGVKTTVVKLENGSKGVVKKYHKDADCDTTAIYEAYIKALKEDNDDQIKARNIIRRAAEAIEKDIPSDRAPIAFVWKVDGCNDYLIRKGSDSFEVYGIEYGREVYEARFSDLKFAEDHIKRRMES